MPHLAAEHQVTCKSHACSFPKGVSRGDAPGWGLLSPFLSGPWLLLFRSSSSQPDSMDMLPASLGRWWGRGCPWETDGSASVGGRRTVTTGPLFIHHIDFLGPLPLVRSTSSGELLEEVPVLETVVPSRVFL